MKRAKVRPSLDAPPDAPPEPVRSLLTERFHPLAELFPLLEGEAFEDLKADIKANGLNDAIVEYEGQILDGRNRYRACMEIGVPPKFRQFPAILDPMTYVLGANLNRRHLNESQRGMVMARMATFGPGKRGPNSPPGLRQPEVAKVLSVGLRTGQRAKVVLDNGVPELVARVDRGELAVAVAAQVAKLPRDQQEAIASEPEANLRGAIKASLRTHREVELAKETAAASALQGTALYSVIYADPPWRFEPYSSKTGMDRAADNHYPTLTVADIRKMTPPTADDCALFLWATAPMLPEALDVMAAWGFTYKSHWIWEKDRIGTGYWTRNKHELLLIGTKGKIPAPAPGQQYDSIIPAALGRHSEKPEVFAEMIDEMFPTARPLEMFARKSRAGWDVFGNEVGTKNA